MDVNQSLGDRDKSGDLGCYIRVERTLPSGVQETITIPLNGTTVCLDVLKSYDKNSITAVILSEGIETVGVGAFYHCSKLASVTFGNSVTTVGDHAFYGCSSLASLTLGDSIETVSLRVFDGCVKLEVIYIKTHDEIVFARIKELLPENLHDLAKPCFSKAKSARSVIEHDKIQGDSTSGARVSVVVQSGMFAKKSNDEPGEEAIVSPSYPQN